MVTNAAEWQEYTSLVYRKLKKKKKTEDIAWVNAMQSADRDMILLFQVRFYPIYNEASRFSWQKAGA